MTKKKSEVINAFHPDYVKTYHPELLTQIRTESAQTRAGKTLSKHVTEKRKTKPTHGHIAGLSKLEDVLAPTPFRVYSRAGTK